MRLVIDIGNSQIHYGVMNTAKILVHEDRFDTKNIDVFSAELAKLGDNIDSISVSSVVPSLDKKICTMCEELFKISPFFISLDSCRDISFARYTNPQEIGSDILASLVYASKQYHKTNLIIVDLGTANTIVALNKHNEFLGGVIMPGIKAQYKALIASAEKLEDITLSKPNCFIGDTTEKAINSGIVNGIAGSLKFVLSNSAQEQFGNEEYIVLATGGASELFAEYNIFDKTVKDIILQGLYEAYAL
ncbi:MAG: type III pantothenate kinase [Alphaproteobacteria bacterium]|jgi:type III pantothenate kinase|nr:type III pantothenate kinase [Candidatus Jidaibacter sp.]